MIGYAYYMDTIVQLLHPFQHTPRRVTVHWRTYRTCPTALVWRPALDSRQWRRWVRHVQGVVGNKKPQS
jgi:hypothetical protein